MATERMMAIVGARISEFKRKMAEVNRTMRKTATNVVVNVEARTNKAQQRLDRLARTINSIQTVGANMAIGSLMAVSPSAIPILAAMIASLAMLGPMLGVLSGASFALVSALVLAGGAAAAFGGLAIPAIAKLFDETTKLNESQRAARKEFDKVSGAWKKISKSLEKPVLEAFGKSMQFVHKVLHMAEPLFASAAKAANNLLDSLNASLDSTPVKAFFDYMNKEGGPLLETIGKSAGNFVKGLMSMMTAFAPLTKSTAQGFLEMSQRFSDWAAGLSKSEKFQSFIKYVQENMPKVRKIFGDLTVGIINLFTAFGPLAADMMTGLQGLMARFKEWSSTLSENQAFQKFIGYIRENGPKVMTLIGNLTDLIVNLAIGMAPLGSKILDLVNKFLAWSNSMMEAHPWIGKFIGGIIVFIGIFRALLPLITVGATLFSGFSGTLVKWLGKLGPLFNTFKLYLIIGLKMIGKTIVSLARTFLVQAARIAAGFLIAMGPVGWVIATVIALAALVIWKWKEIKEWTVKTWNQVWSWIKDTWNKIKNKVTETARNIWQTVRSKFSEIVNSVREKMNDVRNKVQDGINKVKSFLSGIDLSSMGKNMIRGLINGIGSMAGELVSKAKGVVGDAISGAKRLLGIHSPSRVFMEIGRFTGEGMAIGMDKMAGMVRKASSSMAQAAIPTSGLNPALTGVVQQPMTTSTPSRYETNHAERREEQPEPSINVYNEWDGEKVVSYVERNNARKSRITDGFGGK